MADSWEFGGPNQCGHVAECKAAVADHWPDRDAVRDATNKWLTFVAVSYRVSRSQHDQHIFAAGMAFRDAILKNRGASWYIDAIERQLQGQVLVP